MLKITLTLTLTLTYTRPARFDRLQKYSAIDRSFVGDFYDILTAILYINILCIAYDVLNVLAIVCDIYQ